jgi:SET domain
MTKAALLSELRSNIYIMLKPSPVEGIGVFAVTDIPKSCRDMFSKPDADEEWVTIPKSDIENLPQHAQFLVGNYCLYDDDNYFVPAAGFKKLDISLFLNHSDTPNIVSVNDGDYFEALRDIKAGEELLVDYGEIV